MLLVLLASASGCAGEADDTADTAAASTSARPADETTRRLAEVEFARQCTVAATSFVHEADITGDLDARLAAAGFSHEEWKQWHDALASSPELVDQFAQLAEAGCPAG